MPLSLVVQGSSVLVLDTVRARVAICSVHVEVALELQDMNYTNNNAEQLQLLVQELVQQVQGLKQQVASQQVTDRLDGFEEQLIELSTEVRLQARRSSIASQLQLVLPHSNAGSATASPRVAGPMSASATPRNVVMPPDSSKANTASPRKQAATAAAHISTTGCKKGGSSSCCSHDNSRHGGRLNTSTVLVADLDSPAARPDAGQHLGAFSTMKKWGEGLLDNSDELKKAAQLLEAANTAAAEAQAAAARCQQQVLELRGRQGQAERRLDTLWQLQDAASQAQAAVGRAQQDLQQNQQLLQQHHQNMAAMRVQISQLDARCHSNETTSSHLQHTLQDLQQQLNGLNSDVSESRNQLVWQQQAMAAMKDESGAEIQQLEQKSQQQWAEQQQELEECGKAAGNALDKCEQLRQAAVVMGGRLEGIPSQLQAAIQPLSIRLAAVDTALSAWTASAAQLSTVVQQSQLAAAVSQLSSSWTRQMHELATQLAGLTGRLELLEGVAARQEQVVLQDEFKRQVSQLQSDLEVAILQATGPLQKQVKAKADISQLHSSSNTLEAKICSSEKSLLLGLKAVGDKTALLLQHKADVASFDAWKQQVAEDLTELQSRMRAVLAQAFGLQAVHVCSTLSALNPAGSASAGAASRDSNRPNSKQKALQLFTALLGGVGDKPNAAASTGAVEQPGCISSPKAVATTLPALAAATAAADLEHVQQQERQSSSRQGDGSWVVPAKAALQPESCPAAAAEPQLPGSPQGTVSGATNGTAATVARPLSKLISASPAAVPRPSSMHPWSGNPSPAASELHSAANNAKLAKAARDREAARVKALHFKGVVAALMHSVPIPAPEEVAGALQQQLNALGLSSSGATSATGDSKRGASDTALNSAVMAITRSAHDIIDGAGRLVLPAEAAAIQHEGAGKSSSSPGAAGLPKGVGVLSATGITFSLRQQSAVVTANNSRAADNMAGVLRTSSVGMLPNRAPTDGSGSSAAAAQQQDQPAGMQSPSPTADQFRSMLRSTSAGASKVMSQLGQCHQAGRIGSASSAGTGVPEHLQGQKVVAPSLNCCPTLAQAKQSSSGKARHQS